MKQVFEHTAGKGGVVNPPFTGKKYKKALAEDREKRSASREEQKKQKWSGETAKYSPYSKRED